MRFLTTTDSFERMTISAVAQAALSLERQLSEERANLTAIAISKKLFGK